MKAMAIRLISNKEPVMVIGGHRKNWNDVDLFWRIDECTDPNECEWLDINIDNELFGITWLNKLEKYDDGDGFNIQAGNISLISDLHIAMDDIFLIEDGWTEINISLDKVYES